MLTTSDENKIRKIVKKEVEIRTDPLRGSLVRIEKDRKILKDIWSFVKAHTEKLNDHEKRITHLEFPPKF